MESSSVECKNELRQLIYIYLGRTSDGTEVDFVLYGESGFIAIDVKRKRNIINKALRGLKAFNKDYPSARRYVFCGVSEKRFIDKIEIWPIQDALQNIDQILLFTTNFY